MGALSSSKPGKGVLFVFDDGQRRCGFLNSAIRKSELRNPNSLACRWCVRLTRGHLNVEQPPRFYGVLCIL